ncbi:MAG: SAM-dependent methyltransferase [Acidimicrobiales bacterium]|nr:SAM-dependent methyltransferase [Acidimicrobiales bacterium]
MTAPATIALAADTASRPPPATRGPAAGRPPSPRTPPPVSIDIAVPHVARMYDYLLGGSTNFAVDRQAVDTAAAAIGGLERARDQARANRTFLRRAVRHLAGEAHVRQFLDIGTGIPNGEGTLDVAQRIAPTARVVHVDHDPVVLAHAHTLARSTDDGAAAYIDADLRDPDAVLRGASATLDLTRPVALVLTDVLHLVPDEDRPYDIVGRLVDAVPSGSHLVVSHLTADIDPKPMTDLADRLNRAAETTYVLRDRAAVRRFFDGLDLIDPGVVEIDRWRPGRMSPGPARGRSPALYAAVGRKR